MPPRAWPRRFQDFFRFVDVLAQSPPAFYPSQARVAVGFSIGVQWLVTNAALAGYAVVWLKAGRVTFRNHVGVKNIASIPQRVPLGERLQWVHRSCLLRACCYLALFAFYAAPEDAAAFVI